MILVVGAVLGALFGWQLWSGLRDMFERPVFLRENYRGVQLPTSVGLVLPLAVFATTAVIVVVAAIGPDAAGPAQRSLALTAMAVAGFSLLGVVDDVAVDQGTSGYRGHVRALLSGRMSAGSLKMVVGPAIAVVAVHPVSGGSVTWLLVDGAVVALAANLANLFDRAPGRVTKVSILCGAALTICTAVTSGVPYSLTGMVVVIAAACGILVPELRERLMLGDAGANPLGASIGLAVVISQSHQVRVAVLVGLLAMNLISERVSFSSVIASVAPLRWIDRLGRRDEPPT
ncbi:MAG: hypothetical protein M3Y51_09105 [Actinomycetota bacterium]|nr:hypothetical protein [Actinomycetota bacterium]